MTPVQLPALRADGAAPAGEQRIDAALPAVVGFFRGRQALFEALCGEQRAAERQREVVLPGRLRLRGTVVALRDAVGVAGRIVDRPAMAQRALPVVQDAVARVEAEAGETVVERMSLRRILRVTALPAAVVVVAPVAAEGVQSDLVVGVDAVGEIAAETLFAKAVAVRVVALAVGEARGLAGGDLQAVAPALMFAAKACRQSARVVAAVAGFGVERRRAAAAPGEDVHDAADRVGAVERGGRAAQDFDALDLRERDHRQARQSLRGRIDAHAVDQDQRVFAVRSANVEAHRAAGAAVGVEFDPRLPRQQLRQRGLRRGGDFLARDHRDVGEELIAARLLSRGGDDDVVGAGGSERLGG